MTDDFEITQEEIDESLRLDELNEELEEMD